MSVVAVAESAVDLLLRNLLEIMDEAGGHSHMPRCPAECPLPGVASDCPRSRVQRAASSWTGDKNARCPAQPATATQDSRESPDANTSESLPQSPLFVTLHLVTRCPARVSDIEVDISGHREYYNFGEYSLHK